MNGYTIGIHNPKQLAYNLMMLVVLRKYWFQTANNMDNLEYMGRISFALVLQLLHMNYFWLVAKGLSLNLNDDVLSPKTG